MDFNEMLNSINKNSGSPLLMPKKTISQVDGKQGAYALPLGPDSSDFAIDKSIKNATVVWFITTDSMGNKTTVEPYALSHYEPEQPPDFNKIKEMMESINNKLDAQSMAYDGLAKRLNNLEEALK